MTAALAVNGVAWRKRARIRSISKVDLALDATPLLCGGGNEPRMVLGGHRAQLKE